MQPGRKYIASIVVLLVLRPTRLKWAHSELKARWRTARLRATMRPLSA
jgi:hypothetical protein